MYIVHHCINSRRSVHTSPLLGPPTPPSQGSKDPSQGSKQAYQQDTLISGLHDVQTRCLKSLHETSVGENGVESSIELCQLFKLMPSEDEDLVLCVCVCVCVCAMSQVM